MKYLEKKQTLGNFFVMHAENPSPALRHHEKLISYREMVTRIQQFSTYFQQVHLQKGEVVALCCHNTPSFIYSYFGAISAGAVVTPLNLTLTLEEMAYILSDSGTSMLVIHEAILSKLSLTASDLKQQFSLRHVIVLKDSFLHLVSQLSVSHPVELDPQDTCTLLYTSGTTGKPKGVMLSHHNLLSNARSCSDAIAISEQDVFQGVLPFFHTFGFTVTVLLPLLQGSSLVITELFQPKEILSSLQRNGVTIFPGVPSMLVVLAQALKKGNLSFPSLRLLISGGAPLPKELLNTFIQHYSIPAIEGYGLTEASPVVCFTSREEQRPGSIGKSLPGIEVRILTETGKPAATNEPGELLIKGPNVMKGYFKQPEATKETIQHGWLHTGDIAYQDEDGYLFIVDRKKEMIITGGFNVYPREIEEVLYAHPSILEAAVIGVEDALRGEAIKAFIVLQEEQTLTKQDLMQYLKGKLATYKLPRELVFIESLPKNGTGKIMKKQLT